MRLLASILCASAWLASCGGSQSSQLNQTTSQVYIRVPTAMLSREWVQEHQFNRDHAKHHMFAVGWMSKQQIDSLSHEEKASITILNEEDVATGLLNPFTLEHNRRNFAFNPNAEDYHNHVALTSELQQLANAHSDIAHLESVGKSLDGRDLWLMRISSPEGTAGKKPKLLYIANMHGDEIAGRELAIYHIRRLLNDYGSDARVTSLLDHSEVFVMPSMNPDGYERRTRGNARGVDLNRDFPDFSTSDNRDTPAGRAVETAAIMKLHETHHFVSAINFHGGEVCFNLPWDTQANEGSGKFGDDAVIYPMGRAYADANATMFANRSFDHGLTYGYEWYEVDGGMQDWSIHYRDSMHATVELSYAKRLDFTQLPKAWAENKDAMLAYQERSLLGVHVEAVDADGAPISGIKVEVDSSTRPVTFKENFGSRTTTAGNHKITVLALGYLPNSYLADSRSFDGNYDRIVLTKTK